MTETYSVIQYGTDEDSKPATVRSGLTFEKAEKLKERCELAGDKGASFEIHHDQEPAR